MTTPHPLSLSLRQRGFAFVQVLCAALALVFLSTGAATAQLSSECRITSFSVGSNFGDIIEYEEEDFGEIYVLVPYGALDDPVIPTITISAGATVDPASGEAVIPESDGYVPYTVTAEDGTERYYDVYFYEAFASADMLSMTFGSDPAQFEQVNEGVWFVTYTTTGDITALTPTYTLSPDAWCDIASESPQDFTNAVEYTVYSADGIESTTYVVMVTVETPILVNADGTGVLRFTKKPPTSSWSTSSVAGAAGTITTVEAMDTAMNNIAASSINSPLSNYNGTATGTAHWRLDRAKLGTQPTGNSMTLLQSTLKNNSGGTLNGLAVSYEIGATNTPVEQINGYRVYWSLTGAAGSWTPAGTHLQTTSGVSTIDFTIEFSSGWANNGDLYVVWADDNGTGTQGIFTVDKVSFTPIAPAASMLTFSAAGVSATITGTEIHMVAPPGVDTTNLAPVFTLSYGATSDFASGVARDFSNPVFYTITSSDSQASQIYTVTIVSTDWRAGLVADYYNLGYSPGSMPDYDSLTPDQTSIISQINYPNTNGAFAGMPQNITNNFGLRFNGALYVETPGTYTIFIDSDDGSKLWLNDELRINNDGNHPMVERSFTLNLAAGYHPLLVEYYEATGGAGMIMRWSGPNIAKQVIPASALWRIGAALTATTTELVSSLNPSSAGDSVTFTATLRNGGNVATTATGTYAFRRNETVVAIVPIVNGVATYTTSTLQAGLQTIRATYSGNEIFRTSEDSFIQTDDTPIILTVHGGTGSGTYEAGATVTITADLPAQGKVFDRWVFNSGSAPIADENSAYTTVTLTSGNVTLTATYGSAALGGVAPLAWYDASDATSITASAGKVSQWNDLSGYDRHVSQAVSGNQPALSGSIIEFNGSTNYLMHNAAFLYDAGGVDVYIVGAISTSGDTRVISENRSTSNAPLYCIAQSSSTQGGAMGSYIRNDANSVRLANDKLLSDNTAFNRSISKLYLWQDTGSTMSGRVNGGSATSQNYTRSGAMTLDRFTIGAIGPRSLSTTSGAAHKNCGINEVIVTPNLPDADRQKIEGYLAHKWDGIRGNNLLKDALPAGHPYKVNPPVMNTPPVAIAQNVSVTYATAQPITLTGNDPDGNPLTYTIVTQPSHGDLTGTPPNITYTPELGYSGSDSFTFKVNDGHADSPPATVSITVAEGDRFAQWKSLNNYNLIGEPTDDDDGDGLSNFDEFAFGLDPTSGSSANPIVTPLNKATHSFSYTRYAHSNLTYTVWVSTDLVYWGETAVPVTEIASEPDENNVVTVEVTLDSPPVDSARFFLRVQAE